MGSLFKLLDSNKYTKSFLPNLFSHCLPNPMIMEYALHIEFLILMFSENFCPFCTKGSLWRRNEDGIKGHLLSKYLNNNFPQLIILRYIQHGRKKETSKNKCRDCNCHKYHLTRSIAVYFIFLKYDLFGARSEARILFNYLSYYSSFVANSELF